MTEDLKAIASLLTDSDDVAADALSEGARITTYPELRYDGYRLACEARESEGTVSLVYSTRAPDADRMTWRAAFPVPRPVWEALEQLHAPAHTPENEHFCGAWIAPDNHELVARIRTARKPAGHVVFRLDHLTGDAAELLTDLRRIADGVSHDTALQAVRTALSDTHEAFLLGRRQPLRTLIDWGGLCGAAQLAGYPVDTALGDAQPLDLLIGRDWMNPSSPDDYWRTGLALGYPVAATLALLSQAARYRDPY